MIEVYGVFLILLMAVVFYIAGLLTANWYNNKARREEKYALETQYLRLKAGADAHDPVGPYVSRAGGPPTVWSRPVVAPRSNGFDCSQIKGFEEQLNNTGSATVLLKNPIKNKNEKENEK